MSKNNVYIDALATLNLSFLASEVPAPEPGKAPPEWIKLTPIGQATTRDGRSFTFDPARLAARFTADKVDIPVDLDHSTVLLGGRGETPKTVGYISVVEPRDDGTYGRVKWNPAGIATLAAETHRYVSPSIHADAAGNVTWLHSAALVSAPALSMPALASAGAPATLAAVADALNLPATAGEAAILAAIGNMVPKATHQTVLEALTASTERLAALSATTRKSDVDALILDALRERKIVPAQRDLYVAMCATEAGVETFKGLMKATMPMLQPSGLDGLTAPGADRPATAQDIIDKANAYRADKARLGIEVAMSDAISIVGRRSAA